MVTQYTISNRSESCRAAKSSRGPRDDVASLALTGPCIVHTYPVSDAPVTDTKSDKKLSYRRGTARRAMLVNSCYVSRSMGARKVANC